MDPETKRQLDEIRVLVKDNHDMLRAIRRGQWLSAFVSVVFWAFVVVTPLYLYQQYVQPLVEKVSSTTGATSTGPFGLPTFAELQKLLNSSQTGK